MLIAAALGISLAINGILFLIAFRLQSDKLTDFSYALSFITVAAAALLLGEKSAALYVAVAMIIVWALRLGGFLVLRIRKSGRDARFDGMREHFFQFAKFWIGQGFAAWVLLLPLLFIAGKEAGFSLLALVGVMTWLCGLVIETTADLQKYRFSQNKQNEGTWIETGIWRYSRHPNYFGEIVIWVGLYLYALPFLSSAEMIVALTSPLLISFLLLFVSGVPILEKSADKRWGTDKNYQHYKKVTSVLVPFPKKKSMNSARLL